jgi:multiple sugar transport system permease protein
MHGIRARRARLPPHERGGWRHVPAAIVAAVFLLPLAFMVSGSLRRAGLPPPRTPELAPREPTLDNYERAFELVDLGRYTLNSALVVASPSR